MGESDFLAMPDRERALRESLEEAHRVLKIVFKASADTRCSHVTIVEPVSEAVLDISRVLNRHTIACLTDGALPSTSCEPSAPGPVTTGLRLLPNSRG